MLQRVEINKPTNQVEVQFTLEGFYIREESSNRLTRGDLVIKFMPTRYTLEAYSLRDYIYALRDEHQDIDKIKQAVTERIQEHCEPSEIAVEFYPIKINEVHTII